MNRRHFLSSLAALPFVGILVKAEDVRPESTLPLTFDKMTMYKDKYQIFTPAEISRRWVYASTPCFMVGDTGYAVGTWKLKLMLREGLVGTEYGRYGAQQIASTEINRLGLTHDLPMGDNLALVLCGRVSFLSLLRLPSTTYYMLLHHIVLASHRVL